MKFQNEDKIRDITCSGLSLFTFTGGGYTYGGIEPAKYTLVLIYESPNLYCLYLFKGSPFSLTWSA